MKVDVGLVGKGKWGLKVKSKLKKISNIKFICGKKKNYLNEIKKHKIKWIFIVTPNHTHYSIVKNCLEKRINVFCEKPLCLSSTKAKKLIQISIENRVKLYVSDLYSFYNKKINKLKLKNKVYRSKFIKGNNSEFFNRFMYHDIGILYDFLNKNEIVKTGFKANKKKKLSNLYIRLDNRKEINFFYNLKSTFKKHYINDFNIMTKQDYLFKMIYNILYGKYNVSKNNQKALFIIKFLEKIKKKIKYEN